MNKECDGCGMCNEDKCIIDCFGDSIYSGEFYYDIFGEIVAKDNLYKWAESFEREAEL